MPVWRIAVPVAAADLPNRPGAQQRRPRPLLRLRRLVPLLVLLPWLQGCTPTETQGQGTTSQGTVSQGADGPSSERPRAEAITIWAENLQLDLGGNTTKQADGLENQIQEYRRINPEATIVLQRLSTEALLQRLTLRAKQGLAPDLVLIRPRHLALLARNGTLRPFLLPAQRRTLYRPALLRLAQQRGQVADPDGAARLEALPYLLYTYLSCYNRERLPQPPTTLDAFIEAGAGGARLAMGGTLELLDWMEPSFAGDRTAFLAWVQRANLERSISFVETDRQLGLGLLTNRFDWIPCSSAWLPVLRQRLGERLGVAPLPAGPAGPARPYLRGRVWGFINQSSPGQQQLADDFALFSTNPVQQRNLSLNLLSGLPVNANLPLPFSGYPELAAMQTSLLSSRWLNAQQVDDLLRTSRQFQPTLNRVITGSMTPAEGARLLQTLKPQPQ